MVEQKKFSTKPGISGCIMSVLLVISFFLPRIWKNNVTVESINTVLIIIILCFAVHIVRSTSSLFFEHVWQNIGFTVLWGIPVFNLLVIASQFIWGNLAFMQTPLFTAFLIMFSVPAFCCYYFTALWVFCRREKTLMLSTTVLDIIGLIYCLIRLTDLVFLPLFSNAGKDITDFVESMVSLSPLFSLIIYVLSLVNFVICASVFGKEKTVQP